MKSKYVLNITRLLYKYIKELKVKYSKVYVNNPLCRVLILRDDNKDSFPELN